MDFGQVGGQLGVSLARGEQLGVGRRLVTGYVRSGMESGTRDFVNMRHVSDGRSLVTLLHVLCYLLIDSPNALQFAMIEGCSFSLFRHP